jgi:hypothetical protein
MDGYTKSVEHIDKVLREDKLRLFFLTVLS